MGPRWHGDGSGLVDAASVELEVTREGVAWGGVGTGFEWGRAFPRHGCGLQEEIRTPYGQGLELAALFPARLQQSWLHLQPLTFLLLLARECGGLWPGLTIPCCAWPLPRFLGPSPGNPTEPTQL